MTDYIADDFASIAAELRKLEADRNQTEPQPTKPSTKCWACHNCHKYKREHEVVQRRGMKTKCLDCGGYVTLEE